MKERMIQQTMYLTTRMISDLGALSVASRMNVSEFVRLHLGMAIEKIKNESKLNTPLPDEVMQSLVDQASDEGLTLDEVVIARLKK